MAEIKDTKTRLPRAYSVTDLLAYKPDRMAFTGEWEASFGHPENKGAWLIWGGSSMGKTTFAMQAAKYLCNFGRVGYDSMEEGLSGSLQDAVIRCNLEEVKGRFIIYNREPLDVLKAKLKMHKSPDFIVLDSLQYLELTYQSYKKLRNEFPNKLFIIISHADGKEPEGKAAKKIRYDVDLKLRVEGFKVIPDGRITESKNQHFVINRERAEAYWRDNL